MLVRIYQGGVYLRGFETDDTPAIPRMGETLKVFNILVKHLFPIGQAPIHGYTLLRVTKVVHDFVSIDIHADEYIGSED